MAERVFQEPLIITNSYPRLSRPDHDIVCIGFGSSSIALAIALSETAPGVNISFLERQTKSTYEPFTRHPGPYMQLSFLNDLVTYENPRSRFSYLSYLRATDQVIKFANLGSVHPLREQFSRYLSWCAAQFEQQVRYGSAVQAVRPSRNGNGSESDASFVEAWDVDYLDMRTGERRTVRAKQVVCAVGLQPKIPAILSSSDLSSSVLHPSALRDHLSRISKAHGQEYHLVVLGEGLQAAEATETAYITRLPNLKVTWIRGSTSTGSETKGSAVETRLNEHLYTQKIRERDPHKQKLQMHTNTTLKSVSKQTDGRLHLICGRDGSSSNGFVTVCDALVSATGYTDTEHKRILAPLRGLFENDKITLDDSNGIKFKPDFVHGDCGIWLLGTLTDTSSNYDSAMAHVATWSRSLAESLVQKLSGATTAIDWQHLQLSRSSPNAYRPSKARL